MPPLLARNSLDEVESGSDVGRAIFARQEFTTAHLEHYITSSEAMFYRSS
jgi:hypothetical protein